MDLLGGCNSDSDSDSDENNAAEFSVAVTATSVAVRREESSGSIRDSQDTKPPPPTLTTTKAKSKADKKKRVMGKKLLKLSSVLPEHILNRLQLGGGGGTEEKYDDDSDGSSDDDINYHDEEPLSRRKTTIPTAASSRNYSEDEGLMGLLSELSKSNSSSSSRKEASRKILGNDDLFSPSTEAHTDPTAIQSSMPSTEKTKITSEPLGSAFLTTTVETTKRKRKQPTSVRTIHENVSEREILDRKDNTSSSDYTQVLGATSVPTPNPASTIPRSSMLTMAPPVRIKSASSLRSAAPPVRIPSTSQSYVPVVSQQPTGYQEGESNISYEQTYHHQRLGDKNRNSAGSRAQPKKKKQLSRKRQMEQMLRAGKLDEVEGDHELNGVSHVYNQEGNHEGSASSMMSSSSSNGVGVRVVPTGSYDASLGATAMTTDVTSRQKNSNQLNSLLANAASLESHRTQNPQFQLMGSKGKSGSHRATAKRKYGW